MSTVLQINESAPRDQQYEQLIPQLKSLVEGEANLIANLANISAALNTAFGFFWVGFYLIEGDELVLGPYQGPLACTRIPKGKGVCGSAWARNETILVDNVEQFPGHIACSADSKSEIVVPIFKEGNVIGVLDVDSDQLAYFTNSDKTYLEKIAALIGSIA